MKKKCYKFGILILVLLYSCNKKTTSPTPNTPTTPTTAAINYFGVLNSSKAYAVSSGTVNLYAPPYNDALFSNASLIEPFDSYYTNTTIEPGQVSVNGVVFVRDTFNKSISPDFKLVDSSKTSFSNIQTWNITGGSGISSFTYIDTVQFPIFTNFNSLLDTIKLSQNNIINLPGLSNCDEIYLTINTMWKNITASTSITITASDLSSLSGSVGSNAPLWIVLYSKKYKTLGGKTIKVQRSMGILKSVYLSP